MVLGSKGVPVANEAFGPLFDFLPDAVVVIDAMGVVCEANATATKRFGWTQEELLGRNVLDLVHPDDMEWVIASLGTVVNKEIGSAIELRVRARNAWRLVEAIGTPFDHQGEQRIVLAVRDLTGRRGWEVGGDDTELFRAIMQNSASITLLADATGTITAASGALVRMTGRRLEQVLGRPLSDTIVPGDHSSLHDAFERLRAGNERLVTIEVVLRASGRAPVPCQFSIVNLVDDPTVRGFVVTGHDISELRKARNELEHLAGHDLLTGLPNRNRLVDELRRRLSNLDRRSQTVVAFIDLDRFKPVNDLYGHDAGDELLVGVARRLQEAVRDDDLVTRFGGDEFVIVAEIANNSGPKTLADRICAALAPDFELSIGQVHISASVGVIVCEQSSDAKTVLAEADAAMYAQKYNRAPSGRDRTLAARRELAERLTSALDEGESVAH